MSAYSAVLLRYSLHLRCSALSRIYLTKPKSFALGVRNLAMAGNAPQSSKQKDFGELLSDDIKSSFKANGKSAFIIGYTGETGKELARILHESGLFKRILLVGRRQVDYSNDPILKNAEQVQVDFDKILEREDVFRGMDIGFSCLGSSQVSRGIEEYIKVEHDYTVNTAQVAKNAGVQQYALISAAGANDKSWSAMVKTKGRAETDLVKIGFEHLTIMRPGALLCDRTESRPHETVIMTIAKPLFKIAPTRFSVPTRSLALALFYRAVVPASQPVEYVENPHIHRLAANVVYPFADNSAKN